MITIKSEKEIEIMRQAGRMLARVMEELRNKVEIGITTKELDRAAEALIFKLGAKPAFKGYDGFPATLCTSVNYVIVHQIPSDYKLKNGDIISLDMGLIYKGFFSDMAITVPVGEIDIKTKKLIDVTKNSLIKGIKTIKPGRHIGDISFNVQKYIEQSGFNVVRDLCGHGIGKNLHEDPQILNYGNKGEGEEMKKGMVLCIEPMASIGDSRIKKFSDDFGWQTKDNSLSAHFEHTVAVTKTGYQILTTKC